jgi:primase-polymerase (primpol)-like protein
VSEIRACDRCRGPLPRRARVDARFCSTRCRVAAHRARRAGTPVPVELRSRPRWVRWSQRKVPLTAGGRVASSTDPSTWGTWGETTAATAGVGVGFVLNGDGIVCMDLDGCLDGSDLAGWAAGVLAACPRTYVEVSPSGRGLHVWGRASLAAGRVVRVPGGKVEMYPSGRYITMTGRPFRGSVSRLGDLSAVGAALLA